MNRLKILAVAYACDPMKGSESGVGWGWVNAIAKSHDVTVLTADYNATNISQYLRDHRDFACNNPRFIYVRNRPWHYRPSGLWPAIEDSIAKPLMNLAYQDWLRCAFNDARRELEQNRYDLVHLITYVGWRFPGSFYRLGIPFVWGPIGGMKNTPWRLLPILGLKGAVYYGARNLVNSLQLRVLQGPRCALRTAGKGVIAATSEIREELRSRFKVESSVICEVGPPQVGTANLKQRGEDEPLRICWSGQHLPGKALPLLLRAAARLPKESHYTIEILGDGHCNRPWRYLASRLNIDDHCHWHGWLPREQSLAVMKESHVFAITSLKDLTSTVALEAISLGLPVVSLDHCGFADLVTEECGIKVHPGSEEQIVSAMTDALSTLYRNEPLRMRLAEGAIRRSGAYSWTTKMETLDEIYCRTIESNGLLTTEAAQAVNATAIDDAMDTDGKTVAVVILNWNGGNDILDCLKSVFESTHKAIEVVIVDNGTVDGSSDAIRVRYPQVHFIVNTQNLGFAKGSNQGMAWALERGIRYVLLLNSDARMDTNTIHELLMVVTRENDKVVACPRIYLSDSINGANRLWFAYGTVKLWAGLFQNPAFNQTDSPIWSEPRNMEYASGCCMLIPSPILQRVGMLDEAFFAYCEDIDFSLRVRKAGFRLRYAPSALLWHGSSVQADRTRTARYRYLSTRNNLWVVRKHGSMIDVLLCFCVLPLRSLFRIARMVTGSEWRTINAELRGIRDGIFAQTTKDPMPS